MTDQIGGATADMRSFDEQLGEAIHQVMWRRRITQTDLARQVLGITQSALSQKLRGKRPFYAGELVAIADALELDLNDITSRNKPGPFDGGGATSAQTANKSSCCDNAGLTHLRLAA